MGASEDRCGERLKDPVLQSVSCGANVGGRKAVEPQKTRLAGEATQFFPTCERPAASSAC